MDVKRAKVLAEKAAEAPGRLTRLLAASSLLTAYTKVLQRLEAMEAEYGSLDEEDEDAA